MANSKNDDMDRIGNRNDSAGQYPAGQHLARAVEHRRDSLGTDRKLADVHGPGPRDEPRHATSRAGPGSSATRPRQRRDRGLERADISE